MPILPILSAMCWGSQDERPGVGISSIHLFLHLVSWLYLLETEVLVHRDLVGQRHVGEALAGVHQLRQAHRLLTLPAEARHEETPAWPATL